MKNRMRSTYLPSCTVETTFSTVRSSPLPDLITHGLYPLLFGAGGALLVSSGHFFGFALIFAGVYVLGNSVLRYRRSTIVGARIVATVSLPGPPHDLTIYRNHNEGAKWGLTYDDGLPVLRSMASMSFPRAEVENIFGIYCDPFATVLAASEVQDFINETLVERAQTINSLRNVKEMVER